MEAYISYYNLAKPYPPILSTKPPTRSNPDSNSTKPLSRRTGRSTEIDHNPSDNTLIGRKRTAATMEMEERTIQEQTGSISTSTSSTKFNGLDLDKNGDFLCPSHFSDMDHANHYLGNVASKHFQNQPAPKEGEAVVGFLYRCATKGEFQKISSHTCRLRREREVSSICRARVAATSSHQRWKDKEAKSPGKSMESSTIGFERSLRSNSGIVIFVFKKGQGSNSLYLHFSSDSHLSFLSPSSFVTSIFSLALLSFLPPFLLSLLS